MPVCVRVAHNVNADDTPSYADRSNHEKQYSNMQRGTAVASEKRRHEKQNSANSDNDVIEDVPVHAGLCI